MDLLEDGGDSSSSAPSTPRAAVEAADDRLLVAVGEQQSPPSFSGQCLGDDVSWRGSQVLRLATVQCGSTGRNRHQWGIWQGQSLATLGADVAFLTETALQSDAQHALACKGLLAAGYRVVSHGRSPQCPSSGSTSSSSSSSGAGSGVLLAVRAGYSGGWSDVSRHASGRAVAAVLHTQNGLSLRVAAIYGPVGACLPDFGAATPPHLPPDAPILLCRKYTPPY